MGVSIIIPVYNQWPFTQNCLNSILEHIDTPNYQIIVVDNGSTDETKDHLATLGKKLFGDQFLRIRNPENLNFGPACNQGADASTENYLFFLNNDTLCTPHFLEPLISTLEQDPTCGAIGPTLLYPQDNTVQHVGVGITPFGNPMHLFEFFPANHPIVRQPKKNLAAITGAAFLIRKDTFQNCGGFFEDYKNGFEDLDLCAKIRRRGLSLSIESKSTVFHYGSQTTGRFGKDAHNGKLLYKRFPKAFLPDTHRWYENAGFETLVDASGVIVNGINTETRHKLERSLDSSPSRSMLSELLQKEPLWLGGHLRLSDSLREAGQTTEALKQLERAFHFFPTLWVLEKMLTLATESGPVEKAQNYMATKARFLQRNQPETQIMRIKKLRWLADMTADSKLHHLANQLEATLTRDPKN